MDMVSQSDTTPEAFKKQMEVLGKLGPERRLEMMFELSDNLRELVKAGIRHRHPDYTPQQVIQAVLKLTLDKKLYDQIFPGSDIKP
jgi:hypothetical protein